MTKSTAVTIRVTPELKAAIKKASFKSELSQTQFMTEALEKAVVLAGVKSIKQEGENNG